MFDANILVQIKESISKRIESDKSLLDELRQEVRALNGSVRVIQPRSTTAFSLVASDGGNNQLFFDPFMIQLVKTKGIFMYISIISCSLIVDDKLHK